jgi:hypothetical protein
MVHAAMAARLLFLLWPLLFLSTAIAGTSTQEKAEAWLFYETIAQEYLSLHAINSTDQKLEQKFFKDAKFYPLWLRAKFADRQARLRSWPLSSQTRLESLFKSHEPKLPKAWLSKVKTKDAEFVKQVAGTFNAASDNSQWPYFAALSETPIAADAPCIAADQACNLLAKIKTNDIGENALQIMESLRQNSSPLANSPDVMTLHALRLFQKGQYAETLRLLVTLQNTKAPMRLIYDHVQRIFSSTQTGKGDVSLKSNF